jgi:MFS transporter, DHA3 family, macrolide efflux protein
MAHSTAADRRPPERPAPVGHPFLIVWFGQTVSAIGSMLSGVGIAVWVFLETGSAAWLGALIAVAGLPSVVLMPWMRTLDRLPRRRVMIAGDLLAALAALGVLVLVAADRVQVWQLVVASFVGGAGTAFQVPAFQAAIPTLVPAEALARANGLTQFGPAVGVTIGPLLAAPVVGWWGLAGIVVIDLVTFVVAVGTTLAVRFGDRADAVDETSESPDDGSWRAAFAWLWGPGRALLALLGVMAVVNLVLSGSNVAWFALAIELGGTELAGVPLAAGGVAMIAGSVLIGARGLPARRIRGFALALVAIGLGCFVAAAAPSLTLLTIGVALALLVVPATNAAVATVFHEHVPVGMQGRVFAARGAIGQSLQPVGSIAAGGMIAAVAEPAMADGAWAGRTVGRLIGTGAERAPALVLIVVGIALALIALRLATSWIVAELDRPLPPRDPAADGHVISGQSPPEQVPGGGRSPAAPVVSRR